MDYTSSFKKLNSNEFSSLINDIKKKKASPRNTLDSLTFEPFPLSQSQNRIWYQQSVEKNKSLFNNPLGLHIKLDQNRDLQHLKKVINTIIKDHEILRTTFHIVHEKPMQKISSSLEIPINYEDLRSNNSPNMLDTVKESANKEARKVFDLEKGPLIRFSIYQIANCEYVFLLVTHHLISDGWSNNLFFMKIAQGLFSIDKPTHSNAQYRNFVFWEEKNLLNPTTRNQLSFWKNQLNDELPDTKIFPLIIEPSNNDQKYSQKSFVLDSQLCKQIRAFSKQEGVTPFVTLLTGFQVLLYRYTGKRDLLIGFPVVNRKTFQFQETLGLFINLIPMYYKIDPFNTFQKCIEDININSKNNLLNSEIPFNILIQELSLKKHSSRTPLFNILFVYQNFPHAYEIPGVSISPFEIDIGDSQFPITFIVEEIKQQFNIKIKFKNELYSTSFIDNFLQHYKNLLYSAVQFPRIIIGEIAILSKNEQNWLLEKAVHPEILKTSYDTRVPLFLEHFMSQVLNNPHNTALEYQKVSYSFQDLNKISNQLANYLITKKAKPGNLIAFSIERSDECVIIILAILKLGCAFIPLDPSWPINRQRLILQESQANFLITNSQEDPLGVLQEIPTVLLNQEKTKIKQSDTKNTNIAIPPSSLAYIIYTSGSTGTPKGVAIEHRQLAYYLASICHEIEPYAIERFGFLSSFAVDMGFTNLFVPLSKGKIVNIIPKEISSNPDALSLYLKNVSVDCLKMTPSQLAFLLNSQNSEYLVPKKLLILAGEPTPYSLIEKIQSLDKHSCKILISYGPTETTIGVLTFSESKEKIWDKHSLLGHPNLYNQIYILDENKQLVPPGVMGELYIGGETIARGYLNNPETNTRFIPDPFSKQVGKQLFCSGDLARYLPTGDLEFHGRKDRQIKIRGYRVEPQEIEVALELYPNIEQALVLYINNRMPERLTAFLVANRKVHIGELKTYLQHLFPIYMIPSHFIILDSFPLTVSGKIDQELLKQMTSISETNLPLVPRDAIELTMLGIWEKILRIRGIGINESFFSLGGHSFLALELVLKIKDAFQIDILLSALFENDTIEKLSNQVRLQSLKPYEKAIVKIRNGAEQFFQFFVHPAGGQVLCYYDLAQDINTPSSIYGLQSPFIRDKNAKSYTSIEEIATVYFQEMEEHFIKFPKQKVLYGGWSLGGLIAYQMALITYNKTGLLPFVVILDQPIPSFIGKEKTYGDDKLQYLLRFLKQVQDFNNIEIEISRSELEGQSFSNQCKKIHREFTKKGLLSDEIHGSDFEKFLNMQKAQSQAATEYQPQIYIGNVLLIRASNSHWKKVLDPSLGWSAIAQNLTVQSVPGTHISMMQKPEISKIAIEIDTWISKLSNDP